MHIQQGHKSILATSTVFCAARTKMMGGTTGGKVCAEKIIGIPLSVRLIFKPHNGTTRLHEKKARLLFHLIRPHQEGEIALREMVF